MSDTPQAVFMSYAREDTDAARRIAEALRGFGVEVWFDQSELRGGDTWDEKIRGQIRFCTLFLAVISAHTQARREGYFRREWKLAIERTSDMAAGVPFLVPVVVDDTAESRALVPAEFLRVQWTRLPGGLPTPQFIEQIKRLLAQSSAPELETGRGMSFRSAGAPPRVRRRIPAAAWGAAVVALVAAGLVWWRQSGAAPNAGSGTRPPTTEKSVPAATDKSIAVLPFENRSADKESNAVFTDGVHEDILTNLAHIRELRVVSRTSVEQYRKTAKPMPQIARELGVTFILEGSVQRDGNKVRVTGQLIRAASDEHVWADKYDRDLTATGVFAIQSELAQAIAGELKTALSPQEKNLLARRPTENLAAYELYLKARNSSNRESFNLATAQKQESLLQAAVELDPKFAAAWGFLGGVHARFHFNFHDQTSARLAKATAAIDRAVSLASDSPEVIASVGRYYYLSQRDYARATEQFEKLLRTEPNSGDVWQYLGVIQRSEGRWLEAIASHRKAVQLDPGNIVNARNLVASLRMCRRWEEALVECRRLVALDPELFDSASLLMQVVLGASGSTREWDEFVARRAAKETDETRLVASRKNQAQLHGDFAEASRLDRQQPYNDRSTVARRVQALNAAEIYQAQGDVAAARARLENFPAELRARLELEPTNSALWQALSRMEAILGHNDEALRCARKATELPAAMDKFDGPPAWINLAVIHVWTGDKDRAVAELGDILRRPSYLNVHFMKTGAAYAPLRGDPRFEALLNDPKNNAPLF